MISLKNLFLYIVGMCIILAVIDKVPNCNVGIFITMSGSWFLYVFFKTIIEIENDK